jgi:CelD/BcsL family acetyltransferase involved in cellulose biosynthesis
MQHSTWLRSSFASFGIEYEPRVLVHGSLDEAAGIAALGARRDRLQRLELVAVRELHEPIGLLATGTAALEGLAEAAVELVEPMVLLRVPRNSPFLLALRRVAKRRAIVQVSESLPYSYIDFDTDWRDPESRVSRARRSDLRRKRRAAEKLGSVVIEDVRPTPNELEPLLAEALRIEASGWKGRAGTALARDERRWDFYRRYLREASGAGLIRFFFLRVGDRRVAMQIHAEFASRLWQIKVGYDETFRRVSPGMLLTLEIIRVSASEDLEGFEFLGSVEPWTTTWTSTVREFVTLRLYPLTIRHRAGARSAASLTVDAVDVAFRRVRPHVRRALRRA